MSRLATIRSTTTTCIRIGNGIPELSLLGLGDIIFGR